MPYLFAALVVWFLAGSAGAQVIECSGAHRPQHVAELIFGRSIAGQGGGQGGVSEEQWTRFVDNEITPRFPDGLTVYEAAGQWWDKIGRKIVREPSKIVLIVLPGGPDDMSRLKEIAEAYKKNFRQDSVGTIIRPACVAF
jgi:hypothetical protein